MALLANMTWGQWLLATVTVGTCMFLIIVILLQRGRGGGLAGAFGGGGGGGAFGAKTGDVFTWITVSLAAFFLLLAVVGNFVFEPTGIAIATPPTVEAPSDEQPTVRFPLDEGIDADGVSIKMLTEDGQEIPIDAEIIEEPLEGAQDPQSETPAPQSAEPQAEDTSDPQGK